MKDISIYFTPVEQINVVEETIGSIIQVNNEFGFPELSKKGLALMYVPEFRNGYPAYHGKKDSRFREAFYNNFKGDAWAFSLYDLGDLLPGETVKDTYFALGQACSELIKNDIIPLIIGGTQDLTYAIYQGYEVLEQMVNVMSIDNKLDLGDPDHPISKDGFVSQLLMHRPCYLFNYSVLGYQTPLVKQSELDLFTKLYFDTVRLGEFNADFRVGEPLLRNSDVLTVDLQAIRSSDFQGLHYTQPNGFFNHEICQLARYAGISDKLSAFGVFNLIPDQLTESNHAQIGQMLWYFCDGYSKRVGDFPHGTKKDYTKFTVFLEEIKHDLIFYKSDRSDRWWMEVPYPPVNGIKYERHHMVPCNKLEYDNALKGEIPDLWWRTYQKLG